MKKKGASYWYYNYQVEDEYNMYPYVSGEFTPMECCTHVSSRKAILDESRYDEVGMKHTVTVI